MCYNLENSPEHINFPTNIHSNTLGLSIASTNSFGLVQVISAKVRPQMNYGCSLMYFMA